MNVLCVIPARYASTRLPGKPLKDIAGKPMICRVYERAAKASKRRACAPSPRARKPLFCPAPPRVYAFIYTQHTAYPIYFCTFVGLETAEGVFIRTTGDATPSFSFRFSYSSISGYDTS